MNWYELLAIVGSNVALIVTLFYLQTTLWLHTDSKVEELKNQIIELYKNNQGKMK